MGCGSSCCRPERMLLVTGPLVGTQESGPVAFGNLWHQTESWQGVASAYQAGERGGGVRLLDCGGTLRMEISRGQGVAEGS